AQLEVFVHGELGKDVAALGHIADPESLDLVGREGLDGLSLEEDASAVRMEEAEHRLEHRRLSGAVRPDDAGDRARLHLETHPVQDVDPRHVSAADVVQLEEWHEAPQRPRYASRTRLWLATSSNEPSAMSRPSCITDTRGHSRLKVPISCETIRM